MKRIKELIMKDLLWKCLSVAIAVCLWFVVINIENPIETRTFSVPVVFENEGVLVENGLMMTKPEEIEGVMTSVNVRGHRLALDTLKQNRSKIEAKADFDKMILNSPESGTARISIDVKLPVVNGDTFEILSRNPSSVYISVDKATAVEHTIRVAAVGNVAEGYVMDTPQVMPETIYISGAASDVTRVVEMRAEVNVDQITSSKTYTAIPIAYDSNNTVVENLSMSLSEVEVQVNVRKTKVVPVRVTTQGLPAEGYAVDSIVWQPEQIEIVGSETAIAGMQEIVLPIVNIENKMETVEEQYAISSLLPDGISIRPGTTEIVTVKVEINLEAEKTVFVPASNVQLEGSLIQGLQATYVPEDIQLALKGPAEILNTIEDGQVTGRVSIDGLGEGEHSIMIVWDLPEGITIVGDSPTAEVAIESSVEEPVEEEPETPADPEVAEP